MVYLPAPRAECQSYFEVDSTESIWYTQFHTVYIWQNILKLTPQSQYGIEYKKYEEDKTKF